MKMSANTAELGTDNWKNLATAGTDNQQLTPDNRQQPGTNNSHRQRHTINT
jgi:hypothetical protein